MITTTLPSWWLSAVSIFCPSPSQRGALDAIAELTWGMNRPMVRLGTFALEARIDRCPTVIRETLPLLYRTPAEGGLGMVRLQRSPRTLAIQEEWRLWNWGGRRRKKGFKLCEKAMRDYAPVAPRAVPWQPDPRAIELALQLHHDTLGCYPWPETPTPSLGDQRWVEWVKSFERMLHFRDPFVLEEVVKTITRDVRLMRRFVGEYAPLAIEREIDDLAPLLG